MADQTAATVANVFCRVYWGSHGCALPSGHDGPHECACCECEDHERDHELNGCAAKPPYYGPGTGFYGVDAEQRVAEMKQTARANAFMDMLGGL